MRPFFRVFLGVADGVLSSHCVVVWVLFLVSCFFCFTSLGERNTKKLPIFSKNVRSGHVGVPLWYINMAAKKNLIAKDWIISIYK